MLRESVGISATDRGQAADDSDGGRTAERGEQRAAKERRQPDLHIDRNCEADCTRPSSSGGVIDIL